MARDERHLERLSPRLRMIANGNAEVNTYRAQLSGSVRTTDAAAKRYRPAARLADAQQRTPPTQLPAPPDLRMARSVEVSCFVHLEDAARPSREVVGDARPHGQLHVADLTIEQADTLARRAVEERIAYIETGSPLSLPKPSAVTRYGPDPAASARAAGLEVAPGPVLLGFVDVGGFDFAHPDFLRDGRSRFHSIWDQGVVDAPTSGAVPFGRLIGRDEMDRAIADAARARVAPSDLLAQTQQQDGAHATHVASIAGGNAGVHPDADLAGVLLALTEDEQDRHATFADSTRLALAVDHLFALGDELGYPTVVNISLGTNGHAHDGTSPISRWIDTSLSRPGRCVTVAVGNAGQEGRRFEGDLGYLGGRIHSAGRIAARGLSVDLQWQVVGNGIVDVSENEMEIWYGASDEFAVSVRSPSGTWSGPVGPHEYVENRRLPSDTFLSIYSERYHTANGDNRISVFLSPRLLGTIVGVEAGTWTVRLTGVEVRDGRFDAWIERDDPRPLGRTGEKQAWRFPSLFSAASNVDRSSVSSLACGRDVIAVGNCDGVAELVSPSSSQGPTRDGRSKPDICAPGTDVSAARGFAGAQERQLWMRMSGTSMASPYVAGVAAHMLSVQPRLTSSQIAGIMRRTARPLPGIDYRWRDDAGYGEIQPAACVAQARDVFRAVDLDDAVEDEA